MRNNKGFSLVELIVVIAIMAILAAVAIPTFATFIGKAQQASDVDFMAQIESAAELAFATKTDGVTEIDVELNTDNTIKSITVKIGTTPYKFTKNGNAIVDDYEGSDKTIEAALTDFKAVADFSYKFQAGEKALKSENWNSTWKINGKTASSN